MASHLASLWKWDFWNSEMAYLEWFLSPNCHLTLLVCQTSSACKAELQPYGSWFLFLPRFFCYFPMLHKSLVEKVRKNEDHGAK